MSHERKSKAEQNAQSVAQWLLGNADEFEQQGVSESALAAAVSLPGDDLREALDYLENREDVVRFPKPLATPPQSILKPGRGWREIKAEAHRKTAGG